MTNIYAQKEINFQHLNGMYYNYNDYTFKGFSAELKLDLFDKFKETVKDEKYRSVLNNIVFKLDFFSKDSVSFRVLNADKIEDKKIDQGFTLIMRGMEQTVKGFMQTWTELTFSPLIDTSKYNYKSFTEDSVYGIESEQHSSRVKYYLTSDDIDSVHIKNNTSDIKMYPLYEVTGDNKRIIKSFSMFINNIIEISVNINYKDFDKIKIPEVVSIKQKMPGNSQELKFSLTNIELRK